MTQYQQLWIDFRLAIEQAIAHPEAANLSQLWRKAEQRLAVLERDEKLRAAGEAIAYLADIHYARAEWMLGDWDQRWADRPTEEPVLTDEMLSSFLRQTMSLNLEELLDDFIQSRTRSEPEDSVAGEVEKQAVLDWLEQEEKERALAVAHDENVSEWIGLIQDWLMAHAEKGGFRAIASDLKHSHPDLTPVAIWLALLLGGFALEGEENFYSTDFSVGLPR